MTASGPEHAYSSPPHESVANDNGSPARKALRRLAVPQWVALVALITLIATSTVHALTPLRPFVPTPEFDGQMKALALAIMLMPCDHREPGYPDLRVADLHDRSPGVLD